MKFNPLFMFSREESETKVANDRLLSYSAGLTGQNMTYNFVSTRLFVYLNTILKIPSEKNRLDYGYQHPLGCCQRPPHRRTY